MISGSRPGEIYLFKGLANHEFAAPVQLQNKAGKTINIGSTGSSSTVVPADWDGDGDLDLIVGDIKGDVYLVPNEGTAQAYSFGKETQLAAEGKPVHVASRAGPCVADWDGDGDLDLLVGADDGSVVLYRNIGSAASPKLAPPVGLVPKGETTSPANASGGVRRGGRAKIAVADWNGDGKPDLLVGDFSSQRRPEPTAEEKTRDAQIRRELDPLAKRYAELENRLSRSQPVQTKEARDELTKEMNDLRDRMSALQSKVRPPSEYHGWVWLFLRK